MEQEKSNARRDRISIAENNDDKRREFHQQDSAQVAPKDRGRPKEVTGTIANLKWKVPSNGIAGLL
ncbi:hypothetical protein QF042_004760 [Pedobacter sp. W3I1]|uniref:hypothetical protein n=1 Tax=Pedobacter sp. W3I1 TaxID=3042291 RepID=UPI002781000B|nr:hypothetical protein [Pedobacter sp. W3I1]MDQ0641195.1 hypothetical protein [Pedobacter sp. W3I1]